MKASIAKFRSLLMAKPETAAAIVPSARYEICMDLNGDGKADFAFIDSKCDFTGNGTLDTFAIDVGADGEFDLYLKDSDGNFVPDEVYYVEDGANGPGIKSGSEYHDTIVLQGHGRVCHGLQGWRCVSGNLEEVSGFRSCRTGKASEITREKDIRETLCGAQAMTGRVDTPPPPFGTNQLVCVCASTISLNTGRELRDARLAPCSDHRSGKTDGTKRFFAVRKLRVRRFLFLLL